jgi:hypothetical protein
LPVICKENPGTERVNLTISSIPFIYLLVIREDTSRLHILAGNIQHTEYFCIDPSLDLKVFSNGTSGAFTILPSDKNHFCVSFMEIFNVVMPYFSGNITFFQNWFPF